MNKATKEIMVIITEAGNGFPAEGDVINIDDDLLYEIVEYYGPIMMPGYGQSNKSRAIVRLVGNVQDLTEEEYDSLCPCEVQIDDDKNQKAQMMKREEGLS